MGLRLAFSCALVPVPRELSVSAKPSRSAPDGLQTLTPRSGDVWLVVPQQSVGDADGLGAAAAARRVEFRLEFGPLPGDVALDRNELGIMIGFAGPEIQFTSEDTAGLLGMVKRYAEFAADDRPLGIDGAFAVDQRRTGEPCFGLRQMAPCPDVSVLPQNLLPPGQVSASV